MLLVLISQSVATSVQYHRDGSAGEPGAEERRDRNGDCKIRCERALRRVHRWCYIVVCTALLAHASTRNCIIECIACHSSPT